jgi:hypothetical protein
MEIERDRSKRLIKVTMKRKINELAELLDITASNKKRMVPIPSTGYIVEDYEYEQVGNEEKGVMLDTKEQKLYMKIVGCLLWIAGVRLDITFAVMYLTWYTKSPRRHHLNMAFYLANFLWNDRDTALVLGGEGKLQQHIYTDSSLGRGKNRRSITAVMEKLNPDAGAVTATSKATQVVRLASFESELDAVSTGFKKAAHTTNILTEMSILPDVTPTQAWSDNEAMINFVRGEGIAKGVRHMELRMWYVREYYKQGRVLLGFMPGAEIPADKLTKPSTKDEFKTFQYNIMGHKLLE